MLRVRRMLVLAIADHFLAVVGLVTVILWTIRITRRLTRRGSPPPKPRVVNLTRGETP